ncbi:hypothetical protein BDP81DRAFT_112743 [Colletotrichum phormii]|uniref:Uncharacterized protein n=1 Tax=Colletotrichum phormii TaxID=359342 RepID=A0AAJ0E9Q5_9PEZI|nr:uncharacterized protein BDP81DRAFT_112743 [Colletotrichum phormii]KAK1624239.1 hypothetical protein BDP81DRAFT_112743 [Colletotrichum phormii]
MCVCAQRSACQGTTPEPAKRQRKPKGEKTQVVLGLGLWFGLLSGAACTAIHQHQDNIEHDPLDVNQAPAFPIWLAFTLMEALLRVAAYLVLFFFPLLSLPSVLVQSQPDCTIPLCPGFAPRRPWKRHQRKQNFRSVLAMHLLPPHFPFGPGSGVMEATCNVHFPSSALVVSGSWRWRWRRKTGHRPGRTQVLVAARK